MTSTVRVDREFSPIFARNHTLHSAVGPMSFDYLKLIVIRAGSARMFSEFGTRYVNVGDIAVLSPSTLFGREPEGVVTTTTLCMDLDYIVDQVFWRHANELTDRLAARRYFFALYTDPARIMHLGEDRAGSLMPWLDDLVGLTADRLMASRFYRAQALLSQVLDVLAPQGLGKVGLEACDLRFCWGVTGVSCGAVVVLGA